MMEIKEDHFITIHLTQKVVTEKLKNFSGAVEILVDRAKSRIECNVEYFE